MNNSKRTEGEICRRAETQLDIRIFVPKSGDLDSLIDVWPPTLHIHQIGFFSQICRVSDLTFAARSNDFVFDG